MSVVTRTRVDLLALFLPLPSLTVKILSVFAGFLGQAVCKRAAMDGYQVTSLSRRGRPPFSEEQSLSPSTNKINYLAGDAREKSVIVDILREGGYVGALFLAGTSN